MLKSKTRFKYLEHVSSINKDGEKYLAVSVLDGSDKFSFITHDEELIKTFSSLSIEQFSDIVLIIGFERVFNQKTRYFNWQPVLLGVE